MLNKTYVEPATPSHSDSPKTSFWSDSIYESTQSNQPKPQIFTFQNDNWNKVKVTNVRIDTLTHPIH